MRERERRTHPERADGVALDLVVQVGVRVALGPELPDVLGADEALGEGAGVVLALEADEDVRALRG